MSRNSSGIKVFIRNEIASKFNVQRLYSHYKDFVILQLNGINFDDNRDILLYFTYISPEGSPVYTEEKKVIKLMRANISIMKEANPEALYCIEGNLTLSKTTNFRLVQIERNCRRQFQTGRKWQKGI